MNLTLSSIDVLRYIATGGHTTLATTNAGTTINVETGKQYKVNIKVDTNVEFDSIGFDLNWDTDVEPIFTANKVDYVDGDLFTGVDYDLIVNPFMDEKRIYITKALDIGGSASPIGDHTIVSIKFKALQVGDKVHLYITFEEEIQPV